MLDKALWGKQHVFLRNTFVLVLLLSNILPHWSQLGLPDKDHAMKVRFVKYRVIGDMIMHSYLYRLSLTVGLYLSCLFISGFGFVFVHLSVFLPKYFREWKIMQLTYLLLCQLLNKPKLFMVVDSKLSKMKKNACFLMGVTHLMNSGYYA